MNSPTLESKTVRPGSLGSYSYYHSNRRPVTAPARPAYLTTSRAKLIPKNKVFFIIVAVVALAGLPMLLSYNHSAQKSPVASKSSSVQPQNQAPITTPVAAAVAQPAKSADRCAGNSLDKLILVSVSQRHLWACEGSKTVRQSAIITGMLAHASTLTPPGTYKIYGKVTDTTLSGSDETGSWNDSVYYWMPFLNNQYGTYGFHDATWRADSAFGKVDPNSADASHGCIELPLGASKWLYNWSAVGTTLIIEA